MSTATTLARGNCLVDGRDQLRVAALHRLAKTGAQQRVYHNRGVAIDRPGRVRDPHHLQAGDAGFQQTPDHQSVAAVIAGAAENHHALARQRREFGFEKLHHLGPGARHQHVRRRPAGDRLAVRLTHLLGRQNLHAGTPVRSCSSFCKPIRFTHHDQMVSGRDLHFRRRIEQHLAGGLADRQHDHIQIPLHMDVGQRAVREGAARAHLHLLDVYIQTRRSCVAKLMN